MEKPDTTGHERELGNEIKCDHVLNVTGNRAHYYYTTKPKTLKTFAKRRPVFANGIFNTKDRRSRRFNTKDRRSRRFNTKDRRSRRSNTKDRSCRTLLQQAEIRKQLRYRCECGQD